MNFTHKQGEGYGEMLAKLLWDGLTKDRNIPPVYK